MNKYQNMSIKERKQEAAALRQSVIDADERAAASYERSGTDGFLSQWASGLTSQLHSAQIRLLAGDLTASFDGLYEGERRVKAKIIRTQYGQCWLLHEDETALIEKRGKAFVPFGKNSRIHKSLGLTQEFETAPAWADVHGEGRGLAGAASCSIRYFRTGDKWGLDAKRETE